MSKLNHRRPYLVYKDNMERVRNNIPYYLDTAPRTATEPYTPTQTETLLVDMLSATDAYYEAYHARIELLLNRGKRKQQQALQEQCDKAYETMSLSMRGFIAHVLIEGINNNMQMQKQDSTILKRLSKDLGGMLEFAEAFKLQAEYVEDVAMGRITLPVDTSPPAPSI